VVTDKKVQEYAAKMLTVSAAVRSSPPTNMNLSEAAIYLCVSAKTIRRETYRRSLKVARVGRRLIYRRCDLDRYLELKVV
jgi:excisionase family DNA binding protein